MAKRKKRVLAAKKKKGDDDDNDDVDEPVTKKVAVSSSTSFQDEEASKSASFNIEGVNIGRSDTVGGEVGFSSHFWCNYCEYSSDTKKELVTHMRQHMTKCSYCNFSSLSKAEIAKHVKCEHADEAEKTICEVDSSSSGTEHDMDKDPCSACIFCEFMTYSTEHLEKHTTSKHQGMLPKSVAKMISKHVSARIRKDDALFYIAISSDSFDKPNAEGENFFNIQTSELNERMSPIVIKAEEEKQNCDVKPNISRLSPVENPKADMKPNAQTLSQIETTDSSISDQGQDRAKAEDWRVKVETLYCLLCPYSNVAIEKLKCHALTQHPEGVAAASFTSEATHRLQDITFYCARESCSYSTVQCSDYEDHLMKCCSPQDLLFGEKERLKDTIKFIFKCQEIQGTIKSADFLEFSSQYISCNTSSQPSTPHSQQHSESLSLSNTNYPRNGSDLTISSNHNSNKSHFSSIKKADHEPVLNSSNVPQMPTLQDNNDSKNFPQSQIFHTQENVDNQPGNNNSFFTNVNISAEGRNYETSNSTRMQQGQTTPLSNAFSVQLGDNVEQQGLNSTQISNSYQQNLKSTSNSLQPNLSPGVHNNYQPPNTNSQSQNAVGKHNQDPVCVSINSNTVSVEQQNISAPHFVPNSTVMVPSFDSQSLNNEQSSFSSQQRQQSPPTLECINTILTTTTYQQHAPTTSTLYGDGQQPKMLDLLSDANAILMDNDLSIQSWPATQSHDPLPSQQIDLSQSSLHTPPLPQDDASNPSNFAANANLESGSQPPTYNFPNSDASPVPMEQPIPLQGQIPSTVTNSLTPSTNQYQPPFQQNDLAPSETVIDLDNPSPVTALSPSQQTFQNTTTSMNFGDTTVNPSSHESVTVSSVPNFLAPSASTESMPNNSEQPDSFLNNSTPLQPPSTQSLSMDYPSTPPSQKNIPIGTSRFPVSNSPLSPSIYLGGNGTRPQGSSSTENSPMQPAGPSPMGLQFRQPLPQGMNPNNQQPTSNVRQRLFPTRGQPRGPRMQHRMVRPPANSLDDDVIVTAVTRGPVPQRPPIAQRGRGAVNVGRGMGPSQRGMGPNQRGMSPNQRGMSPNQRGLAPNARGMVTTGGRGIAPGGRGIAPGGRGIVPGGRGMLQGGRGMAPRGRGRAGVPVQRGRGGVPRGRGGAMPSNMSPHGKKQMDVSRHFVDLACVVNANEEGEEDEIQIVGVTPAKGGTQQPKAVDAKKFSYCCIHCGQDQGSKDVMKEHIKSSHCESLLGAFRNVETGQWLYFCPQLTCDFMTYDENRLINHLFACYNLDKSKPLPYDMQSALRNLKSLRIRQVNVQRAVSGSSKSSNDLDGQGLRDAFNNNLKDAFDDMVENTMGRQMVRPNQPLHTPMQRPPPPNRQQPIPYTNQRGALRGPYSPRGTPPKNLRQRFPGPGQMSPGYRQRSPMMGGSPGQPRHPNMSGRFRAPGQQFQTRGMSPGRGGLPPAMRGQRPPNPRGGFIPRPNLVTPSMPGNEQSPIVIDLDVDSPGKATDDNERRESTPSTVMPDNPSSVSVEIPTAAALTQVTTFNPVDQNSADTFPLSSDQLNNTPDSQIVTPGPIINEESTASSITDTHSTSSTQKDTPLPSNPSHGDDPSSVADKTISSDDNHINPTSDNSHSNPDMNTTETRSSSNGQTTPSSDTDNACASPTSVRNIPSPSQLLAEMNALANKQAIIPQLPQKTTSDCTPQESGELPPQQNPQDGIGDNSSLPDVDEELVNTILLDKVFAKVPHMPKKLSQRLVLKFKKYAADRGMIITPTSRVIDEFVSKISYKGSHSAPTPIGQDIKNNDETNRPPQPAKSDVQSVVQSEMGASSKSISPHSSANREAGNFAASAGNQSLSSSSVPKPTPKSSPSSPTSAPNIATNDGGIVEPPAGVGKPDDVIETKVIFAERKLEFKGAFANIIKEKNTQSNSTFNSPSCAVSDNSESSPQAMQGNSTKGIPSSSDQAFNHAIDETDGGSDVNTITENLKKEIIEPVSFPSVCEENSIEVNSSVDHIVSGNASLEVDIAGKPLSASVFMGREEKGMEENENVEALSPKCKDLTGKSHGKTSSVNGSTGTLNFKIKKGSTPRMVSCGKKDNEIVSEKSEDSNDSISHEDQLVRRSERKRKIVKVDYNPDELGEMDALMSDEDDEYHIESDESYDGSDSDGRGRKKAKRVKVHQDPTAFDLATKGCFGCWKCDKVFSRVMFLKRHIIKKHKSGLCAIMFTETGIPLKDQPNVLLFCPQSCKYVTSDYDVYPDHLRNCAKPSLNIVDIDYKNIQETFFKNEFKPICEAIASGSIQRKIPAKPTQVSKRKSSTSTHHSAPHISKPDAGSAVQQTATASQHKPHATTIITTATIHHAPCQPLEDPYPLSPPHLEAEDGHNEYHDNDKNREMMSGEGYPHTHMFYQEDQHKFYP